MVDIPIKCQNGHAQIRFDLAPCDAHKAHRVYTCPMRRGRGVCGDLTVIPPFGSGCEDEGKGKGKDGVWD